jgi:hypothetical protein
VSTVLVAGLGDLGSRVLATLARSPNVDRLIGASRNIERGGARAAQCRLVASLQGGPKHVEFEPLDLTDIGAAAALLRRLDPDVVVTAATRHTWWRGGVEGVPYGAWLPLQLTLVRDLMRAKREAGIGAPVVCLPFPDGVGPALAPLGLAPEIGAGNVGETAPKLALLSGGDVRLVMHHAAQRYAFPSFAFLGADGGEEPPWVAEVLVNGKPLPQARVEELFHADWPLPTGTVSHDLTAASTVQIVEALLGDTPARTHAPAPAGRPGGYPVLASRGGVTLDLPPGLSEADAIELNTRAGRWDGLEAVEADGTLVFTEAIAESTEQVLGVRIARIGPGELDDVALELERARDRWNAST